MKFLYAFVILALFAVFAQAAPAEESKAEPQEVDVAAIFRQQAEEQAKSRAEEDARIANMSEQEKEQIAQRDAQRDFEAEINPVNVAMKIFKAIFGTE